ncbi:MAG: phosphoglycerate kinase [Erysipelotrichales bacterium]|nr:phosphoglycerate kinase [Erysipelotrichales bacterium]
MNYIENIDVKNKKVILRLDLNVTIKNNVILDDTKIKKSIPTIKYLLNNNARVLIMSHLGKVNCEEDKITNSLKPVCDLLSNYLNMDVKFIPNTRSSELETCLDELNVCLMENTRFEDLDGKKESNCDDELSRYWASLGDIFINDAFGSTHRRHASTYGISKHLPSAYGFLVNEEITGLDPIINNIERPFAVIMGGAKVDDKIALIETLIKESDYLLVGGGIANTFLAASGYNIGNSLYSADYVDKIKEIIEEYKDKIYMPVDLVVKEDSVVKTYNIEDLSDNSCIYDIGEKSITLYKDILNNSKTIFINGTVGMYEDENFRNGTESLYKTLANNDAIIIAGGGDAVASVNKLGFQDSFDFLSTGGGATLEYIANKKIACFED